MTQPVLAAVAVERRRQDTLWGEQNHPDGTGNEHQVAAADVARTITDRSAEAGTLTWAEILTEEVTEVLAETDPGKLRDELVQVAAVATAWIEALDRRGRAG